MGYYNNVLQSHLMFEAVNKEHVTDTSIYLNNQYPEHIRILDAHNYLYTYEL